MSLIKLSNGVEISEETVVAALEKAGIEAHLPEPKKPKHIFEAGDVAKNEYGEIRIIIKKNWKVYSFGLAGEYQNTNQCGFERLGYQYIGRLEDLLKI